MCKATGTSNSIGAPGDRVVGLDRGVQGRAGREALGDGPGLDREGPGMPSQIIGSLSK